MLYLQLFGNLHSIRLWLKNKEGEKIRTQFTPLSKSSPCYWATRIVQTQSQFQTVYDVQGTSLHNVIRPLLKPLEPLRMFMVSAVSK